MKAHIPALICSLIIVLGSIGLTATKGLNFGIDFTGGMLIEVRYEEAPDLGDMRNALNNLGMGSVSLQEFGTANDVLIRFPQSEDMDAAELEIKVKDVLNGFSDVAVDYRRFEFVGPQVGEELIKAGILAIIFSIGGILAYVSFRFEWQFGIASVVALTHDALAIIGLFALTQMEFDLATVAAVLMIAGYSINDTVVVFDRVRENLRKYKKKSLPEILDMSLNQTLARTLLTSVTTLIALIALYVFGGEVIRGFVDALMFGILIGTYSSVFVASPVLIYLGLRAKDVEAPEVKTAEEKLI
jgi:preprotein translocase subunit SecF